MTPTEVFLLFFVIGVFAILEELHRLRRNQERKDVELKASEKEASPTRLEGQTPPN